MTASKSKLWPDFCAGLKTGKGLLLLDFVVFLYKRCICYGCFDGSRAGVR
ncbi:hypothetical protein [Synechococcus sp. UW140]